MKKLSWFLIVILVFLFVGCAALDVTIENRNLQVISNLSEVPFFDSHPGQKVFVRIKNFSDYRELNKLNSLVAKKYEENGFIVVSNPENADWIIQAKIVNIKKEDFTAAQVKGTSTSQEAVTGGMLGGAIAGINTGSGRSAMAGALIGGILTGAANLTVNNWVTLGYLTIITDIEVKERAKAHQEVISEQKSGGVKTKVTATRETDWIKYRLQALTRAKKANLEWEDCKDAVVKELTRILASLL